MTFEWQQRITKNSVKRFAAPALVSLFVASLLIQTPGYSAPVNAMNLSAVLDRPAGRLAKLNIDGGVVYEPLQLKQIYQPRGFEPLWLAADGRATPRLVVVRSILQQASQHGMEPKDYWHPRLEAFYKTGKGLSAIDFELGVTETLVRFVRSVNIGQVDPTLVDDDIKLTRKAFGATELQKLIAVLGGSAENIEAGLIQFEPKVPLYQTLKAQLRAAKVAFTQDQLNKIAATMEKLRWLPSDLGDRYALVNLAMTELKVVEKGAVVLAMKTINGRPVRRTPMMIDSMKRVELNPTWTVPLNLAIWDKLPKIKNDLGFLARNRIRVFAAGSTKPIDDVSTIDWTSLSREHFPYTLQQQAGPGNVLGIVKFPLTNGYSIYLHDTDERNLFNETGPRLRSSGCVRLQKPMELASYLLKDQVVPLASGWKAANGQELPIGTTFNESILMSRVAKVADPAKVINPIGIAVENPLPLYTAYLTADIDDKGAVRFVQDKYKQDARLLGILKNRGEGTPVTPVLSAVINEKMVPVQIRGNLGPTQLFGNVVAIRCVVWPYKGCVEESVEGKETREEYRFQVNEEVMLPQGHYILGAENSMLPGWLGVKCTEDELGECAPVAVFLEKIEIPEKFAEAEEVFVYRDMSSVVEQNKILSQSFHNGQALIKQTPASAKNFYVPGINQFDVVQRLNTDFCDSITSGKVGDVAPEVAKYCESLSEVIGMAEYLELPVFVENENAEGTSEQVPSGKPMKVFQFPRTDAQSSSQALWHQRWVGSPGNWIDFSHRRYLVAAPLFPKNISPEKRFVAVLPGQYRLLAVNSDGNAIGQTMIRTDNIDENYERVAREVILGE